MTDIFSAIGSGDPVLVDQVLRADRTALFARTDDGVGVVLWAMYVGQPRLASLLAHAKRDLDIFETAAVGMAERLGELVDQDVRRVHQVSADGYRALHLAALFGHAESLRRLLTAGSDPDAPTRNTLRATALHCAVAGHHGNCVRTLLNAGAEVDAREQGGWTALHLAARNSDRECLELLLAAGADRDLVSDDGHTAAELAATGLKELLLGAAG